MHTFTVTTLKIAVDGGMKFKEKVEWQDHIYKF